MYQRIVYVSRAREGISGRDAYDIIRVAHNRNSRLGLTGALLLLDGFFIQILEGERHHVASRFAVIAADPRHHQIDLRQSTPIERLSFPGDWMALRRGEDVPESVRRRHDYRPGLPADTFDPQRIVDFAIDCCRAPLAIDQGA